MSNKIVGFFVGIGVVLLGGIILCLFLGLPVLFLWNWLMPEIFGLKAINFWQAIGILFLSHLIFKSGVTTNTK